MPSPNMQQDQDDQNNQNNPDNANGGDNNSQQDDTPVPAWQAALFESRSGLNEANRLRLEAEDRANQAQAELARIQRQNTQQQRVPLQAGDVFNDPERFRTDLLTDMANQIAPLNNMMAENQRIQNYNVMKMRLKQLHPHLMPVFQSLEPQLDGIFYNSPGLQPTESNIVAQLKQLLADAVLANMGNQQPNNMNQNNNQNNNQQQPQNNNQNNNNNMPAHLRPSARNTNNNNNNTNNNNNQEPQLTENERRLARENNQSPQEFILMRDTPPDQIGEVWKQIKADRKKRLEGK